MDDADLDLAVDGILWSAFGTSGQRCTAASRVIVHEEVYDELQGALVEAAETMRLGPGWEDDTDVGPVINQRALDKIHSYTRDRQGRGREAPHRRRGRVRQRPRHGFYYRPTIFGDVEPGMRIAQEEIFGPTTALIPVDSLRRGGARRERRQVRALVVDLHARRQPRVPRDARPRDRHHVHQRGHDRRRGAPAVRRHEGHRQRPPRGRAGGARRLHGVEVDLRRLLRQAAARADRQHVWRAGRSRRGARDDRRGASSRGSSATTTTRRSWSPRCAASSSGTRTRTPTTCSSCSTGG